MCSEHPAEDQVLVFSQVKEKKAVVQCVAGPSLLDVIVRHANLGDQVSVTFDPWDAAVFKLGCASTSPKRHPKAISGVDLIEVPF